MYDKREIRTTECQLVLREVQGNETGNSRTIRGYAIVFDRESVILAEDGRLFVEVIAREAVPEAWLLGLDVKMNMLHDRTLTFGRYNRGEGNMRVGVDDKGVWFEVDVPRCDIGDRCLEMVREKIFTGCSFEFRPKNWDISQREDDMPVITITEFEELYGLTVGMDPAYVQTSVSVREILNEPQDETPAEPEEREVEKPAVETPVDRTWEKEKSEAARLARDRELELLEY